MRGSSNVDNLLKHTRNQQL